MLLLNAEIIFITKGHSPLKNSDIYTEIFPDMPEDTNVAMQPNENTKKYIIFQEVHLHFSSSK